MRQCRRTPRHIVEFVPEFTADAIQRETRGLTLAWTAMRLCDLAPGPRLPTTSSTRPVRNTSLRDISIINKASLQPLRPSLSSRMSVTESASLPKTLSFYRSTLRYQRSPPRLIQSAQHSDDGALGGHAVARGSGWGASRTSPITLTMSSTVCLRCDTRMAVTAASVPR